MRTSEIRSQFPVSAGIVLGYGIPPDILKDGNYRAYFRAMEAFPITDFILCGGPTNIHFPEKTETAEMARLLQEMIPFTDNHVHLCNEGITSWDNLVSAQRVLDQLKPDIIFVFCERTRTAKIRLLAKHFLKSRPVHVIGIDFDQSKRTLHKDLSQIIDFGLTALRIYVPQVGILKNWLQRKHIARVSQK